LKEKKINFEDAIDWLLGTPKDESSTSGYNDASKNVLDAFIDKPFYIWTEEHQEIKGIHDCCFNHMIGLPLKNDEEHPLYDYEKEIFDGLELKDRHLWVKKSRGIGVTELILRYITWRIVRSHELDSKNIFIVSGTKEEFANKLKERLEKLFDRAYPLLRFQSKFTELIINKTWIKVFPSQNVKTMRGYTDVSYIFIDESDFFQMIEQNELEFVIKSYEEKSKGKIIMVSTPNRPDGLFYKIEHEGKFGKSYFHKILLDYRRGLGKIYDDNFIARERNEPYFEREYNLKYLGKIGNVFSPSLIQQCTELGEKYKNVLINTYAYHPVGCDYGYSDSKTVLCIGEWDAEHKRLWIVEMIDFGDTPPTPEQVANRMFDIYQEYGPNTHFFVDGSNAGSVNQAKIKFSENTNWRKQDLFNKTDRIHPVHFGVDMEHKKMLFNMYDLCTKGMLAINERFDKLITSMRTAQMEDWDLNKDETVLNDYLDAARLMCKGIALK